MPMKLMIVVLAGLLAACASPPREEQTVEVRVVDEIEPTTAESDPNEVVCRRRHKVGTNFGRMECMTRAEMDAEKRRSESDLRHARERVDQGKLGSARSNL